MSLRGCSMIDLKGGELPFAAIAIILRQTGKSSHTSGSDQTFNAVFRTKPPSDQDVDSAKSRD